METTRPIVSGGAIVGAILTGLILVSQMQSVFAIDTGTGFSDVPKTNPYYTEIMFLQAKGIISGYPDGTFKPNRIVNRAEALKIILGASKIQGQPAIDSGSNADFKDVKDWNAWYYPYLNKATALGIISGYPDGTFKPEQTVNLVENLKMLIKAGNVDVSHVAVPENPYTDAFTNQWYTQYVQYGKNLEWLIPDSQNSIFPNQGMTRGKLAQLIYNALQIDNVNKRAVVIIYKNVYDALKPEVDNFQNDVFANLGIKVDVIQLQNSITYTPLDIRNLLIKECQPDSSGCLNLGGAVFVGDIPYALYEQPFDSNHLAPFMYFYEDLDASFKQNNLGHYYGYDSYGAHGGPEIYTGWIKSTFPATDLNNHINQLRAYFQKHHNFSLNKPCPQSGRYRLYMSHIQALIIICPFLILD
ncbi:MAG: S-layer homology domain-containing protein [Candidatus Gracilibacteria bacterium]|jgi:hypothetical protein